MFEILTLVVFVWLFVKCLGLAFRLTWGAAKVLAGFLMVLALPVLLVPCLMVAGAWALLKAC